MDIRHQRNTPYSLSFPMIDSFNPPAFKTGVVVAIKSYTKEISGAWTSADIFSNVIVEIGSGLYGLDLEAGELDFDFRELVFSGAGVADTSYKFTTLPMPTAQNLTVGTLVAVETPASRLGDPFTWEVFQSHNAPRSVAVFVRDTTGTLVPVDLAGRTLRLTAFKDRRPTTVAKWAIESGQITISGSPTMNVASVTLDAVLHTSEITDSSGPWKMILQDVTDKEELAWGNLAILPAEAGGP